MEIHKGPNNVSDSSQFTIPVHSRSVTHGEGSENKDDIYQELKTKNSNSHRKGQNKKKDPLMTLKFYSKPHTCNLCDLLFTYKKVLLKHAHLRHNHDGVNIVCTQKSNSARYYELTILADSKFNKVTSYSCDSCKSVYNRFDVFKCHQRLHLNMELRDIEEDTSKCMDCELSFKSLPALEFHTEQHLTVTSFPSKSKSLVFDDKFEGSDELSLNNQKASHVNNTSVTQNVSTIKIFSCDHCGKMLNTITAEKVHKRRHIGEQPHNCRYCDKSFADTSTRKKHERLHTNERPYACPACTKAFIQKAALHTHIQLHHAGYKKRSDDVKSHECNLCGFFSQSSTEFCLHLVQHSDENSAKSRARTHKYQHHDKLGIQKNVCCLVPKAMPGQFNTNICEDETVPTEDEQCIQSQPVSIANPSVPEAKRFKTVNGKLEKNGQKSFEQVSYGSKYTVLKSELLPKKQCFVLKDGECARTCSTVLYYSSRSNHSNVMNLS